MEPADIDWKNLEWRFVKDDLFEHFNAPKWVDLSAPSPRGGSRSSVPSDEAWFCRPDCRHPKTAEDFLRSRSSLPTSPSKVKLVRTWSSPLGERNQNSSISGAHRDANLKRRGGAVPPTRDFPRSKLPAAKKVVREDLENQDPNLSPATPCRAAKIAKETVKSSAERREPPLMPERPLKSTLSARNLFAGKDILSQISEFCSEIKRLAVPKSESSRGVGGEDKNRKTKQDSNALEEKGKMPLLASGEDAENTKKTKLGRDAGRKEEGLENLRMLLPEPTKKARENSPLLKDLDYVKLPPEPKKKARENLRPLQEVRSCPPTPQRFPSPKSLRRKPTTTTTTPVKSSLKPGAPHKLGEIWRAKISGKERVLGEMVHAGKEEAEAPAGIDDKISGKERVLGEMVHAGKEEADAPAGIDDGGSTNNVISSSPGNAEGSKSVDLFWFFKPCTYLGGRHQFP